jgi:hypothetical protein
MNSTAKFLLAFAVTMVLTLAYSKTLPQDKTRQKRQAEDSIGLPDGAELILNAPYRSGFQCSEDGYYADVDNACQVFHVCHRSVDPEGRETMQQWAFLCGNQTVFNQLTLTCSFEEEAIPCQSAPSFFYLNQRIGQEKVLFLEDNDIEQGYPLYPGYANSPAITRASLNGKK